VDFEVVPGITSALGAAASAKISLTHRQAASAVAFLTSHQAKNAKAADWQAWVRARATLVIYMPGYEYSQIATRLTDAGMPETTACAVVSRATAKDEQILRTTLGALPGAARMAAPTLLFVGEAVGLAEAGEPAVDLERLAAQSAFAQQVSPAPELWFWPQEFSGD
jgi:siroheme synthase